MANTGSHTFISFPPNLKELYLPNTYNQQLPPLPSSLRILVYGDEFNQKIEQFPPKLTILCLGQEFNSSIPPLLPQLEQLSFRGSDSAMTSTGTGSGVSKFDRQIANYPQTLTRLELSDN